MLRLVEIFIGACLYYSGLVKLARWWKQRSGQSLVILNYHRAGGSNLRQHLLYLRRHYRLLHLEAALEELYGSHNDRPWKDRRIPLVLTFDDGNHDNYTRAFKLAQELQIPITMFLIPGYIDSRNRFWWLEVQHLVSHVQLNKATVEGHTYLLDKPSKRKSLAQAIDTHVRYASSVSEREDFLASVRKALPESSIVVDEEEDQATSPLTWAEVQEMEESGWVSFGAHTMHHPILAYLANPAEVEYEINECRMVLERHLKHSVYTFAYPVGHLEHIGENASCAVQKAGYNWAVTTIYGFNTPQSNPYFLRRVVVDADQHWLSVATKASGVWSIFSRLYQVSVTLLQHLRSSVRYLDLSHRLHFPT